MYSGNFKAVILTLTLIVSGTAYGAGNNLLDEYIRLGLENNLALKQKRENYRMSLELLNEARGMFYPSLSFNMRYSVARGGRVIEFPVGDLLNPVYSTLNMLTGTLDFNDIDNELFYFLRPREQETKLRLVQPVIYPGIWYNKRIREHEKELGYIDIGIYRRSLVAEIKTAYFNYLKSIKVEQVLDKTILLLEENVRVNESLAANDMVTHDYIYRSRAELAKADQQLADAAGKRKTAAAWFNFLLNRPFDDEIVVSEVSGTDYLLTGYNEDRFDVVDREELDKTNRMVILAGDYVRLKKSSYYPRLTAVIEYGFQGTSYSFGRDDDFVLASIVLSWPLFEGFQNNSGVRQAKIRRNMTELMHMEVQERLNLEIINAWYELEAAHKAIDAASAQLRSAREAFRITERRFSRGNAPLVEFIDARTNMTNAEINLVISRYDFYISHAEYEKAAALYKF